MAPLGPIVATPVHVTRHWVRVKRMLTHSNVMSWSGAVR